MHQRLNWPLGAHYIGDGCCRFLVWAPKAETLEVRILNGEDRLERLPRDENGYFFGTLKSLEPNSKYVYRLDGRQEHPDPASRFQPSGVHGPSQIIDTKFSWTDESWHGLPLRQYVIYELHVGTFTVEGSFAGVAKHLAELRNLGITAIELMPVAQFPGTRNWGYDGVYPFAVQNSYGGPQGLKDLVNQCHAEGLAVVLDVVYNHLGPEGNYLDQFGHYFTGRYHTPWGDAINYDGPHCDEVRRFFIENAVEWVRDYHIDALRLDAVHAIFDESACPFLKELAETVHDEAERLNRRVYVIEESNKNDSLHIQPAEIGGWGLDGVWNDDFHHAVHTVLTGENLGYYRDFGSVDQLVKAFREGFVYSGQRSSFRSRRHGVSSLAVPAERFVVCVQNHDQVGNRFHGERLSEMVSFEQLKLAAGLMLLSPYVPMLFMGEEYGETAPFLYFTSHADPGLIEAVRRGRQEEFASFAWSGEIPDPQSEETFTRSRLNRGLSREARNRTLQEFYRTLIELRKTIQPLAHLDKERMMVIPFEKDRSFFVRRSYQFDEVCIGFCLRDEPAVLEIPLHQGDWTKMLDSSETGWLGPGSQIATKMRSEGAVHVTMQPNSLVLWTGQADI